MRVPGVVLSVRARAAWWRAQLFTHAPRERLAAHRAQARRIDLQPKLALEQPAARLGRRLSREDASAHKPPIGLRVDEALAEEDFGAIGRHEQHVRARLHEAIERLSILRTRTHADEKTHGLAGVP